MSAHSAANPRQQPEVIELSRPPETCGRPRSAGRPWLRLSFLACVVLPVLAASIYFGAIASDRYVSGAGFSIRGVDAGQPLDGFGALTGIVSAGSTTSDSHMVLNYLHSRDLVEAVDRVVPLRTAFADPSIDPLSRAAPESSIEDLLDYWQRRVTARFDSTSGVLTFEVQAFTPHDALSIAEEILTETQNLVNRLSETARADAVQFAEAEVRRAELRLGEALSQLRAFREAQQNLNPAATAELDLELFAETEARLVELETRRRALAGRISETSPTMVRLSREAAALRDQLDQMSALQGDPSGLTAQLAAYEALNVEKGFAEQSYASALTSLEQARIEANRQQRYLAVYTKPARPEDPQFPRRAINVLIVTAAATALWGIGTLITYSVRDHIG